MKGFKSNSKGSAMFEYAMLLILAIAMVFLVLKGMKKPISSMFKLSNADSSTNFDTGSASTNSQDPSNVQGGDPAKQSQDRSDTTDEILDTIKDMPQTIQQGGNISLFISFSLLALSCLFLFILVKQRLRKRKGVIVAQKKRRMGEDGAVLTEFALIFPIALMLILGIIQLGLIASAKHLVDYAAFCASRSALVWIPSTEGGDLNAISEEKNAKMHMAATLAVFPICPRASDFALPVLSLGEGLELLEELLNLFPAVTDVIDRFSYAYYAVDVTLNKDSFSDDKDLVTADVVFHFPLQVPMINALIGSRISAGEFMPALGYFCDIRSSCTLQNTEGFAVHEDDNP